MRVGVLAMQGAFREHRWAFEKCGCEVVEVRQPQHLKGIEAIALPGGESSTMGKLLNDTGLMEPLTGLAREGLPIFGTCAGTILLAREIEESDQPRIGVLDIKVRRNAYGRQIDSFEADLAIPVLGQQPFHAIFIRAPYITGVGTGVEVLASYQNVIVMARAGRVLVATFHPELTADLRIHRYFLSEVAGKKLEPAIKKLS